MTAASAANRTPRVIDNRPSLAAIEYRAGTYQSFLGTMMERIARGERVPGSTDAWLVEPQPDWRTRATDDYGVAFLGMWSYLGDILTFYQERIANESYVRTAVHGESISFLVSLIGYRPAPGRAASTYLVFDADLGASVDIAAGLLVQSVPGQDEKPQKFETIDSIVAHASLNRLHPRRTEPQTLPYGSTRVRLQGTGHRIAEGDWVAIAGESRRNDASSEAWDLRQTATVEESETSDTTTVTWSGGIGTFIPGRGQIQPEPEPEFWVFRGHAFPFGYNAPNWNLFALPATTQASAIATAFTDEFPNWEGKYLPERADQPDHLYLDTVYPDIAEGEWVALITWNIDPARTPAIAGYDYYAELYPIQGAASMPHQNYAMSGKSTRATLDRTADGQPEHIDYFPMRATTVLIQPEKIALAQVPLGYSAKDANTEPVPVELSLIELNDRYPHLHVGRRLLLTGTMLDDGGTPVGPGSEMITIREVTETELGTTAWSSIELAAPLRARYDRTSVVLYGNVSEATHGETIAGEVLGDGDAAAAFQRFTLKKEAVTFVPDPESASGATNTLVVRVNGLEWRETEELYGHAGDARVFTTRRDQVGGMAVQFGNGTIGARLLSGRGNVEATYRVGLGPDGNVGDNTLRTLLARPLGLKSVTNPREASGGARAEVPAAVRANAPGTVRTFGRIVSLTDFADAAREFVGVSKARAAYVWDGERRVVDLVVAGDGGADIDIEESGLRSSLDARRDPHQPLRIRNHRRADIDVALSVVVHADHVITTVQAAADRALHAMFAFDAAELGHPVHLSGVYASVQAVEGVIAVDVDRLDFKGGTTVRDHLALSPDQVVWVEEPEDVRVTHASYERKAD